MIKHLEIPRSVIVLILISLLFAYLFFLSPVTSKKMIAKGSIVLEEEYSTVFWNITGGSYLSETHVYFKINNINKTIKFVFYSVRDDVLVDNFQIVFQGSLELYLKTVHDNYQVRLISLNNNVSISYVIEFFPGAKFWSFLGMIFFGSITLVSLPVLKLTNYLEKTRS